jgi:methionyl aminopeptidase
MCASSTATWIGRLSITAGGPEVHLHDDGWTISTDDGSLTAHFEHTVAITADGPRVLTKPAGVLVP